MNSYIKQAKDILLNIGRSENLGDDKKKIIELIDNYIHQINSNKDYSILVAYKGEIIKVDNDIYKKVGGKSFYINSNGYPQFTLKGKKKPLHRYIMNAERGRIVDHINRDKIDNRKNNLRFATKQQSNCNRHFITGDIKYRGVDFNNGRYRAQIGFKNKKIHIGAYKNALKAAIAYDKKAIELHGEFAITNKDLGLL